MSTRTGKSWTSAEEARLIELYRDGLGYEQIGDALGRTSTACETRLSQLVDLGTAAKNGIRRWSPAEDRRLLVMVAAGYGHAGIGRELQRTERSVSNRLARISPQPRKRACLDRKPQTNRLSRLNSHEIADVLRGRGWSCSPPQSSNPALGGAMTL